MRLNAVNLRWLVSTGPLGLALLAGAFTTAPLTAQTSGGITPPQTSPYFAAEAVRAAYVLNFIRFTKWPEPFSAGPITVGVAGSRALEDELIRLADRQSISGRPLRIVRIKNLRDLTGCNVIYFAQVDAPADEPAPPASSALPLLRGQPVLTLGEDPGFLALGGIINLYREDEKLRFEIAPDTARDSGLVLSARLLKLARIVREPIASPEP